MKRVTLMMALRWTLLFIHMISGVVVSQQEWSVNYPQKSIYAVRESTVTVGCSYVYNATNSTVQESFWNKKLDTNYKNRIQYRNETSHDCSLIMKAVTQDDQGDYIFTILTSDGKRLQGESVKLSVTDPPKRVSVSISPSGDIMEGSSVTLTCSSDANPPVETYTWFKGRYYMRTGKTFTLYMITSTDSGNYTCEATNKHGHKSSMAVSLNVLHRPKRVSVSISPSGEIMEGSSVTLNCSSDANPPVETYTWYKGTSSMSTGKTYTINQINSAHIGEYVCEAKNKQGHQFSRPVFLNVLYPPKRVSVSISPSGEIVAASLVTLTCDSDANPPVKIYTWYKVNESSPVGFRQSYSFMLSSSSSGWFYCVAQNKHGGEKAAVVHLSITGRFRKSFVAVGFLLCGITVLFSRYCFIRMKKMMMSNQNNMNTVTRDEEQTYTHIDLSSRCSNDIYHTVEMVHLNPPDNIYRALDPQTRSSNDMYNTLANGYYNVPDTTYTDVDSQPSFSDYYNLPMS